MGLFDRIKKSLFGKKDEDEDKKKEEQKQQEKEESTAEVETENQEEEAESASEETPENTESETIEQEKESTDSETSESEDEPTSEVEEEPETEEVESEEADTTSVDQEQSEESKPAEEKSETEEDSNEQLYEKGLEKTNKGFGARLNAFFAKFRTVDEDFFDDLEDLLIESDVGYETAEQLTDELREEAKLQNAKSRDDLKKVIVEKLVDLYDQGGNSEDEKLIYHPDDKPNVYLFVGVNGAGKTTTIGKLAKRFKDEGKSVILQLPIPLEQGQLNN